jgi:hypothetical protein
MDDTPSIVCLAVLLTTLVGGVAAVGCNGNPGRMEETPFYRQPPDNGDTDERSPNPSSGERGSVQITEVNYAGSVANDGTHYADDIFIELQNKEERTMNLTGWRLVVRGGVSETYRIPEVEPLETNEYLVIAKKRDGAFAEAADVFIEDFDLGKKHFEITLLDHDERLMESVGSTERRIFTGGWDTVTVRSMERVQLLFSNSGTLSRSWHAYSADEGLDTVAPGFRQRTLASPGEANSADYSGSTSTGSFE